MIPPGPQIVSNFYLSAFLDSIKQNNYKIFLISTNTDVAGGKALPLAQYRSYQFSGVPMNDN